MVSIHRKSILIFIIIINGKALTIPWSGSGGVCNREKTRKICPFSHSLSKTTPRQPLVAASRERALGNLSSSESWPPTPVHRRWTKGPFTRCNFLAHIGSRNELREMVAPSERVRKGRAHLKKVARTPRFWSELLLKLCRVLSITLRAPPMAAQKRSHVAFEGGASCLRRPLHCRCCSRAKSEKNRNHERWILPALPQARQAPLKEKWVAYRKKIQRWTKT